jgi:superfamily II DNA or RNA helicase
MLLRPYQIDLYERTRAAFAGRRAVCMQLPTGGGKTAMFAAMTKAAIGNGNKTWIVVSRNELVKQSSEALARIGVPHGLITAKSAESKAYDCHVVSKDTLIRRYDKIKNPPAFLVMDESHLYLERQIEIAGRYPDAKILGVTATPERLDGRGLSELYDALVTGPSIQRLINDDFLSPVRYFCPPIDGLESVHRKGTEYNPEELAELLETRRIYGQAIEHYRTLADGQPALVYCRSVRAAALTAARFSDAGYRFENIDGQMSYQRRKALIDALRAGTIQGLTSCDLVTYGLDIPRVSVIIMLRPTLSRALFSQMVGRGLRIWPGKTACLVLDHVNNFREHGHPAIEYPWAFDGRTKRTREGIAAESLKLCLRCFMYYDGTGACPHCGTARDAKPRKEFREVDGRLIEIKGPVKLADRPPEQRAECVDKINDLVASHLENKADLGPIRELADIAKRLGYPPLWVYHRLNKNTATVNRTLLHAIATACNYKPGWAYFAAKTVRESR